MSENISIAEFAQMRWKGVSEREFQDWIVNIAYRFGWHVQHARPAPTRSGGYATAVQGHKGYPDLTLAKAGRATMIWEAKRQDGRVSPEQREWLAALGVPNHALAASMSGLWWPSGSGLCVGVVRPDMRDELQDELS